MRLLLIWTSLRPTSLSHISSTRSSISALVSAGRQRKFSSIWPTRWSSGTAQRRSSKTWPISARPTPATKPNTSKSAVRATMPRSSWSREHTRKRRQTGCGLALSTPFLVNTAGTLSEQAATRQVPRRNPPYFSQRWFTKTSSVMQPPRIQRPSSEV